MAHTIIMKKFMKIIPLLIVVSLCLMAGLFGIYIDFGIKFIK